MTQYQKALFNKSQKRKNYELVSTQLIQNLNSYSENTHTEGQKSIFSDSKIKGSDSQELYFQNFTISQTDEGILHKLPINSSHFNLISTIQPANYSFIGLINHKKQDFQQSFKKKEQNKVKFNQQRQKFQQKVQQHLLTQRSLQNQNISKPQKSLQRQKQQQIESISSLYIINSQVQNKKVVKIGKRKIKRSQTQDLLSQRSNQSKDKQIQQSELELEFNLTKNSQKKKVKLRRKESLNQHKKAATSIQQDEKSKKCQDKQKLSIESIISKQNSSLMKMSKNEFVFLQQYQKDQTQIMNRLLNMIQKQKQNKLQNSSMKTSFNYPYDQKQMIQSMKMSQNKLPSMANSKRNSNAYIQTQYSSAKPIVINNFIKSPTDYLDKKLIERQIAIRMLEENRQIKKKQLFETQHSRLITQSRLVDSMLRLSRENNHQAKQSSGKKPNHTYTNNQNAKDSLASLQKQVGFEELFQKLKSQSERSLVGEKSSIFQQDQESISKESQRNQQFQQLDTKKSQACVDKQSLALLETNKSVENKLFLLENKKKESLMMEISFGDQLDGNRPNISLADAFKKKFGQNKFQNRAKCTSLTRTQYKKTHALSELKNQSNLPRNIQIDHNHGQTVKKQTVKIPKRQHTSVRDKQNFASVQTPRGQDDKTSITDRSICTNFSRQPSKQLLDRLIYGAKANISKKQMYDLTRKNYMKLPEIEQKRIQKEKKLKQLERLQKIKDYQKRIRSHKNSISKVSMANSIESEIK